MTVAQSRTVRWLLALALAGCPTSFRPPGDEVMGEFSFHAEPDPAESACALRDVPLDAGFDFRVTFSRSRDEGRYFVSIGGVPHDAEFDGGQTVVARYSAVRTFADCSCPDGAGNPGVVTMTETLVATIVSRSQSDAVSGCAFDPPYEPDSGIIRPGTIDGGGFDAVRACGRLLEEVHVVPAPTAQSEDAGTCALACDSCRLSYLITGGRN